MRHGNEGHRIALALAALVAGCGEAESATQLERELAARVECNPLQDATLAASLAEPLAVGRTRSGTVYAVTRAGENEVVWRSLGDQLIAYRVFEQNEALGATIFGVDAGSEGFALTLRSDRGMTSLRLFPELEQAMAPSGTGTITGGTLLEMVGPEVLAEFEVATAVSPAQIIGAFQFSSSPESDLFVVRAGAGRDAPLAVFQRGPLFGGGDFMLERQVTEHVLQPDGGVELRFDFFGEQVSLRVDASGREGRLVAASGESELAPGGRIAPLQLADLEFHCATPLRADWALGAAGSPLAGASCAEPERLEHCLELGSASATPTADGGEVLELDGARVLELGSGLPPPGRCSMLERVIPVAQQEHILWARLEHASGEAWLAVMIAEPSLPVRVGDTISLRASKDPNTWSGQRSELTARAAGGELLFWLGTAARPSEFREVPEFEFTLGPERCVRSNVCVHAAFQHALDSWRVDGDSAHVAYGEQLEQGPFRVHNGGVERLTQIACADIPASWLEVGVWRTSTLE